MYESCSIAISLEINGQPQTPETEPRAVFLDTLRGRLGFVGAQRLEARWARALAAPNH